MPLHHIERRATLVIDLLGQTADEVADTLLYLDCTGTDSPRGCPIANYLRRSGYEDPCVDDEEITLVLIDEVTFDTPPAASEFIGRFDDGDFPILNVEALDEYEDEWDWDYDDEEDEDED